MNTVIETFDLTKRFGKTAALDGLSLAVPAGAIYALSGPNGAGKTTAIRLLMNLLTPSSGQARVLGRDACRLSPAELALIGYVSEAQRLPVWMTAGGMLNWLRPLYPTWDQARASELCAQMALPLDRPLGSLSRGMRMKAALAAALAPHPRLLVLDEPFSGLDVLVREELIAGLLEQAGETTILISSHDLSELESFASHFGYLAAGRLLFSEEVADLNRRYREVEVLADSPPPAWPAAWLDPVFAAGTLRFTHQAWEGESSEREISGICGGVRHIEARAAGLRRIFLVLARDARNRS